MLKKKRHRGERSDEKLKKITIRKKEQRKKNKYKSDI